MWLFLIKSRSFVVTIYMSFILHRWLFAWIAVFRWSITITQTRTFANLTNLRSFIRVNFKNSMNKLNLIRCEALRKVYWLFHVLQNFFLTCSFKWCFSFDHFEEEDTQPPNIYFMIIWLPKYHFRGHILWSPAKRHSRLALCCKSKVTDFSCVVAIEQYILWLNIDRFTLMSRCIMFLECM